MTLTSRKQKGNKETNNGEAKKRKTREKPRKFQNTEKNSVLIVPKMSHLWGPLSLLFCSFPGLDCCVAFPLVCYFTSSVLCPRTRPTPHQGGAKKKLQIDLKNAILRMQRKKKID